jgi:hypothetical protein
MKPELTTKAAYDVLSERERQITAEGYLPSRDDGYVNQELAKAGAIYAMSSFSPDVLREPIFPDYWPWKNGEFKPGTAREDLVKSAALLIAEIERMDRKTGGPKGHLLKEEAPMTDAPVNDIPEEVEDTSIPAAPDVPAPEAEAVEAPVADPVEVPAAEEAVAEPVAEVAPEPVPEAEVTPEPAVEDEPEAVELLPAPVEAPAPVVEEAEAEVAADWEEPVEAPAPAPTYEWPEPVRVSELRPGLFVHSETLLIKLPGTMAGGYSKLVSVASGEPVDLGETDPSVRESTKVYALDFDAVQYPHDAPPIENLPAAGEFWKTKDGSAVVAVIAIGLFGTDTFVMYRNEDNATLGALLPQFVSEYEPS